MSPLTPIGHAVSLSTAVVIILLCSRAEEAHGNLLLLCTASSILTQVPLDLKLMIADLFMLGANRV